LRTAVNQSLREFFYKRTEISDWVEGTLGDFLRDTLSGTDEKSVLASPFVTTEGFIGEDGIRRRRGLKSGLRPFSAGKPYAFLSYGYWNQADEPIFNVHFRGYYRVWRDPGMELIGEIPLVHGWNIGVGARTKLLDSIESGFFSRQDNPSSLFLGLRGNVFGGRLYFGSNYPMAATLSYFRSW
jgi:hypothetical protein